MKQIPIRLDADTRSEVVDKFVHWVNYVRVNERGHKYWRVSPVCSPATDVANGTHRHQITAVMLVSEKPLQEELVQDNETALRAAIK